MPVIIQLDRAREVRWTKTARARMSRVDYSFELAIQDMANRRRFLYAVCVFIWSALVDLENPWDKPEQLAEVLMSEDKLSEALKAIEAMLDEAGLKKESKKNETPGENTSPAGPAPSSSSALPVPPTDTSTTPRKERSRGRSRSASTAPAAALPGSSAAQPG